MYKLLGVLLLLAGGLTATAAATAFDARSRHQRYEPHAAPWTRLRRRTGSTPIPWSLLVE